LKIWLTTVDGDAQVAIKRQNALTNDDIVQFIRNSSRAGSLPTSCWRRAVRRPKKGLIIYQFRLKMVGQGLTHGHSNARSRGLQGCPVAEKVAMLVVALVGIGVGSYFYVEEPLQAQITSLKSDIAKLDTKSTPTRSRSRSSSLKQLNAELQRQLSKNQEYLPPEEEAVTLLKQLSDLGIRIVWTSSSGVRCPCRGFIQAFVRLPVDVEMSGGYHTLALFFDRISKLPRIINVNKIKMGGGKEERGVCRSRRRPDTAFASPVRPRARTRRGQAAESETARRHQ